MSESVSTQVRRPPAYPEMRGRVALVSGAAQGIGFSVAQLLLQEGGQVALLDVNEEQLQLAALRLKEWGKVSAYVVDVSDAGAVTQCVETVCSEAGRLDYLVHAAGILRMGSLLDLSLDDFQRSFAVNVQGAFLLTQAVGRKMREQSSGAIVCVASNAAKTPRLGMGAYPATKAAVVQLIRCLALELAPYQVRCNTVSPGSTDTAMQRSLWQDESDRQRVIEGSLATFRTGIPLQRIAEPEDIAEVVLFLLSERARHITLSDVCVDGGATF